MSTYEQRIANEVSHFKAMLQNAQPEEGKEVQREVPRVGAYELAMQLYGPFIQARMPHANQDSYVMDRLAHTPSLRIASLGCGSGDWEIDLAIRSAGRISCDLIDLSMELLGDARRVAQQRQLDVRTLAQDVNRLELAPGAYDFVICRSALHHFIELEHILAEVRRSLSPGGEFLIVGEYIGRNGQQLYPRTEEIAGEIFAALPERLRVNRYTGQVDRRPPNLDLSKDTFEAIRSEDIAALLFEIFQPVEYVFLDAFVSLLLDFRYGPNYDLNSTADRATIERIVAADIQYVGQGTLRPTALFGIFR